jgi:AhpD family alkylhydroperoxidase
MANPTISGRPILGHAPNARELGVTRQAIQKMLAC